MARLGEEETVALHSAAPLAVAPPAFGCPRHNLAYIPAGCVCSGALRCLVT